MKTAKCAALTFTLLTTLFAGAVVQGAQQGEPTVYVIKKGDTLWGLSNRFMKDPYYWPNLWASNPEHIGNPHFIFPGQKLRVYGDRMEVEPVKKAEVPPVAEPALPSEAKEQLDTPVPERRFTVNGGEGFIAGNSFNPSGFIIAGQHNRQIFAEDDLGQLLAQFHTPLVERVDAPDRALGKNAMLVKGHEFPESFRSEPPGYNHV